MFNNINTNVSDKLSETLKKMVTNNNIGVERLTKLSQILSENKLKLEKFKYNYFNACKVVIEQENKIIKLKDNKKLKEEDFVKNNEILGKYVLNAENLESTYKSELNKCNSYNTRANCMAGKLPVSPICNPGIESIVATIEPTSHKYYYFVADKNGKTYFNETSSGHTSTINRLKREGLWIEYEN
jgi:hypothetical protein